MSTSFILGSVLVAGRRCPEAHIVCNKAQISSLDGDFIAVVHKPGTYTLTAHAPGHSSVVKKVVVAKLTGKAKKVDLRIKADKPARG